MEIKKTIKKISEFLLNNKGTVIVSIIAVFVRIKNSVAIYPKKELKKVERLV